LSDILLVAIVGVGGTALGSITTGIISHFNSKQQIKARLEEIDQQQDYSREQAEIERLIKHREPVLLHLREIMSKWVQLSGEAQRMTVRLKRADPRDRADENKLWEESLDQSAQVTSELEVVQGQLSDATLGQMIEKVIETYEEISKDSIRLHLLLVDTKSSDDTSRILKEYRLIQNKLRGYLLPINKRIDELLVGRPSD